MKKIRLNKLIADSGLCSRRKADELIRQGKVTINRQTVEELGTLVDPESDRVFVDGAPLPEPKRKLYLLFNKPVNVLTTRKDEKGRKTIYEHLPEAYHRVDPAGRLDRYSCGALILSDDGDFIHHITHPGFHVPKRYYVRLDRPIEQAFRLKRSLMEGVTLMPENKLAKAFAIDIQKSRELELTLNTGYNRQIRRMFEHLGYEVKRLERLSIGMVRLGNLKPGQTRPLNRTEIRSLRQTAKS
jgi:23S rRNA pseudouridine2605 synthase